MLRVLWQSLPANVAATSGKLLIPVRTRISAPPVAQRKSRRSTRRTVNAFPGTANTLRISLRRLTITVSRFSRGKESADIRIA